MSTNNENKDFDFEMARCIKAIRKAEGLTAVEFGKRVGLTKTYMSRIESGGIKSPPFEVVVELAREASKTNAVRHYDINLAEYQTPFVDLIKYYVNENTVNNNYSLNVNSEIMSELLNKASTFKEEELLFLRDYFDGKEFITAIDNFGNEIIQRNLGDKDFAYWLADAYNKLLNYPEVRNNINELFNHERPNLRVIIRYIFNTISLHLYQTRIKDNK